MSDSQLPGRSVCISGLFSPAGEVAFRLLVAGSNRAFEMCAKLRKVHHKSIDSHRCWATELVIRRDGSLGSTLHQVYVRTTNDNDPSRGKGRLRVSMLEVTNGKIMPFFMFFFWKVQKNTHPKYWFYKANVLGFHDLQHPNNCKHWSTNSSIV